MDGGTAKCGVFITFSGNCKKALSFYQTCFGGSLQFEMFDRKLKGFAEKPVVSGSLVSNRIIIYGSDLVHNEGRRIGNHLSIFLHCNDAHERKELFDKLNPLKEESFTGNSSQKLIELRDVYDVRWVLGV